MLRVQHALLLQDGYSHYAVFEESNVLLSNIVIAYGHVSLDGNHLPYYKFLRSSFYRRDYLDIRSQNCRTVPDYSGFLCQFPDDVRISHIISAAIQSGTPSWHTTAQPYYARVWVYYHPEMYPSGQFALDCYKIVIQTHRHSIHSFGQTVLLYDQKIGQWGTLYSEYLYDEYPRDQ